MNGRIAEAVGRNATLTSRTVIWPLLLGMHTNPWIGVGYDSFWEGSRLPFIWSKVGAIGEAHNGFLEVYLNIGLIGLFLLLAFFVSTYRKSLRDLTDRNGLAPFIAALWTMVPFYNVTEAAFRMHLMWVTFLFAAIPVGTLKKRAIEKTVPLKSDQSEIQSLELPPVLNLTPRPLSDQPGDWDYLLK
jgi:O-antigen ligase